MKGAHSRYLENRLFSKCDLHVLLFLLFLRHLLVSSIFLAYLRIGYCYFRGILLFWLTFRLRVFGAWVVARISGNLSQHAPLAIFCPSYLDHLTCYRLPRHYALQKECLWILLWLIQAILRCWLSWIHKTHSKVSCYFMSHDQLNFHDLHL